MSKSLPREPPVIAIGGGLAGAAFALDLARHGRRVVVLERTRGPHHAVCGEFLSEEAQIVLKALGVAPDTLGASTITHFRLVKGERQATTRLPFKAAGLSRARLDEALLQAAARAGVDVVRGARVTGVESDSGAVTVRTEEDIWRASAAALAIGKHSLRVFARPKSCMVGFKVHLEPASAARDLAGLVQLAFFRGGYVGACLVEDGILSTAWVMRDDLVRTIGPHWAAQSAHLARQSSLIGDLFAGARPMFARPVATAAIPYGYLRHEPIAPEIYPVGDQLAVVPSLTGDGMAIALYSGLAAARAVLAGRGAVAYQGDLVRRLEPQFRLAGSIARLLETPVTCGFGVAVARLVPSLVTGIAAATRLRGFGDIAGSLHLCPQQSMAMK